MKKKRLISIVGPCFNEEKNVREHFSRVLKSIKPFEKKYKFEFIYMDNCSGDRTFDVLKSFACSNKSVKIIKFSRNIGANRSIYIGLMHAKGDAAILIQTDLQDPPEMIGDFITWWEKGFDVVYGKITKRSEFFVLRQLRHFYYKLISILSDIEIPLDAGEFRLVSRRVLAALGQYSEDDIYLRGVIAHIGFKQKAIPYLRDKRNAGKSSQSFFGLIAYGINGVLSSTVVPLRLSLLAGFFFSLVGFLLTIYIVGAKILFPHLAPQGFTTLGAIVTFFAGVQLFSVGIIGEYIRKIYIQSLGRPKGFIEQKINFK